MSPHPFSVRLTRVLVICGASVGIALGGLLAINGHPAFPDQPWMRNSMAALCAVAGCTLLNLLHFLGKGNPLAYWGLLVALGTGGLSLIFDDIGAVDLVFLMIMLVPAALLLLGRRHYLAEPHQRPHRSASGG